MVNTDNVFEAVRRGYNDFNDASNNEIIEYFSNVEVDTVLGHHNNIKGILFELEYQDMLESQGIYSELYEVTNYPAVDIKIWGDEGIEELQLKATDSAWYINDTFDTYPDIPIVTTTEVAESFDTEMVIDSGIAVADLNDAVTETLFEDVVNPIGITSIIRLMFGFF